MTLMIKDGLGILIPTWDRPHDVRNRLNEIQNLCDPGQRVHVQVNPGQYNLTDIDIQVYQKLNITIQENASNYGLEGNILFGIHNIGTEWVWILGDDDELHPLCLERIQQAFSRICDNTQFLVFNQWHPADGKVYNCTSVSSLFSHTLFGEILFVSGLVWRKSFLLASTRLFIEQAFSRASQPAIILQALADKKSETLVVNQQLVVYHEFHRWSRVDYMARVTALLYLEIGNSDKACLAKSLYPQLIWAMRSGFQEVRSGNVKFISWFNVVGISFLQIFRYAPLVPIKSFAEYLVKFCHDKLKRLQVRIAKGKGILKRRMSK